MKRFGLETMRGAAAAAVLLGSAIAAVSAPVYEQAGTVGPTVGSVWTSHFAAGQNGWQTYDDFTLAPRPTSAASPGAASTWARTC